MKFIMLATGLSTNTRLAVVIGLIIFAVLFFKLIVGFIKFCLRHPIIFLVLLFGGGLGLIFNLFLGGIVIVAVIVGGIAFWLLSEFDGFN
ncbi:hypothetical protein [Pediococcus inopinatus]|uniref:hypothetical protein n=1 Tax=Pediococcus inopinatus TaxID=114090 RepID=UPI000AD778D5|nr:hypothetical protein [Pediococcus inopinatus]